MHFENADFIWLIIKAFVSIIFFLFPGGYTAINKKFIFLLFKTVAIKMKMCYNIKCVTISEKGNIK